jgi:hypothetical protein
MNQLVKSLGPSQQRTFTRRPDATDGMVRDEEKRLADFHTAGIRNHWEITEESRGSITYHYPDWWRNNCLRCGRRFRGCNLETCDKACFWCSKHHSRTPCQCTASVKRLMEQVALYRSKFEEERQRNATMRAARTATSISVRPTFTATKVVSNNPAKSPAFLEQDEFPTPAASIHWRAHKSTYSNENGAMSYSDKLKQATVPNTTMQTTKSSPVGPLTPDRSSTSSISNIKAVKIDPLAKIKSIPAPRKEDTEEYFRWQVLMHRAELLDRKTKENQEAKDDLEFQQINCDLLVERLQRELRAALDNSERLSQEHHKCSELGRKLRMQSSLCENSIREYIQEFSL